jgi:hypothetical protein
MSTVPRQWHDTPTILYNSLLYSTLKYLMVSFTFQLSINRATTAALTRCARAS